MDGVLVVDKPSGPTSHDVVARARRLYGTREVGHAGTLDPMASGVLVLMFGQACKLSQYLTALAKRYRAEVSFGRSTDSLDALGVTVDERALAPGWLDRGVLEQAISAERARSEQVPPAISAIQVGGQRAYRAARRGEPLELAPRAVLTHELSLLEASDERVVLELEVSKGYYVRSLARDLGAALGVPAHLAQLRRLASGAFTLDGAAAWPLDAPVPLVPTALAATRVLPPVTLTEGGVAHARAGRALAAEHFVVEPEAGVCAWLSTTGDLIALGQREPTGEHRVVRGFQR